jgi:hypothetical protein
MIGGTDPGALGHNVRSWLHYDQLASTFYKQSTSARQLAGQFETKVMEQLDQSRMSNAVIQIGGGHLNMIEEKIPRCLTLRSIEQLLHGYYAKKGQNSRDETEDVMKYLRANRGSDKKRRLKKTLTGGGQQVTPPQGA